MPFSFPGWFLLVWGNSKGPGRPPKWVEQILEEKSTRSDVIDTTINDAEYDHYYDGSNW